MSNRCLGFTETGKRCRSRIGDKLFCDTHKPYNYEEINSCCVCCEKVTMTYEIMMFKCKHMFHKKCYFTWLENNDVKPQCPICRRNILLGEEPRKANFFNFFKDVNLFPKLKTESKNI